MNPFFNPIKYYRLWKTTSQEFQETARTIAGEHYDMHRADIRELVRFRIDRVMSGHEKDANNVLLALDVLNLLRPQKRLDFLRKVRSDLAATIPTSSHARLMALSDHCETLLKNNAMSLSTAVISITNFCERRRVI